MSSPLNVKANMVGWSPYVKVYDPLKSGSIDGTDLIPHDNAVIRAISAEYKPPDKQSVQSNPCNTLFVSRLNLRTSESQLREEFSKFGPVKSCRVVEDIVTGISRGYGFIEFKREADAQEAWRHAHGMLFHERQILVEWEFSRTMPGWIPRRLGGGLGGRKESGQLRFGGRDRPFKKPFILPPEQDIADSESHHRSVESSERLRMLDEVRKPTSSRSEHGKNIYHRNNVDDDRGKYRKYTEDYPSGEGNRKWQYKSHEVRSQDHYGHAESKRIYRKEMKNEHSRHSYSNEEERRFQRYSSSSHSKIDGSRKNSFEERKSSHSQQDTSKRKYARYDDEDYESRCDGNIVRKVKKMRVEQSSERKGSVDYSHHKNSQDYEASYYSTNYKEKHKPPARENEDYMLDFSLKKSEFRDVCQNQHETSRSEEKSHKGKHQMRASTDSSNSDEHKIKKKKKKSKHKKKRERKESVSSDSSIRNKNPKSKKKKKKKKHKQYSSESSSE